MVLVWRRLGVGRRLQVRRRPGGGGGKRGKAGVVGVGGGEHTDEGCHGDAVFPHELHLRVLCVGGICVSLSSLDLSSLSSFPLFGSVLRFYFCLHWSG